jgi:hypothetical protein
MTRGPVWIGGDGNRFASRTEKPDHSWTEEATMDTFPDCRCLICYCEGRSVTFTPKSPSADFELECPQCLNNDSDYIEKIDTREMVAV